MFERFINFAVKVFDSLVDFAVDVFDFMSYELDLSILAGGAFSGTITVFELMFGAGITVYLTFVIGKFILD